MKPTTRPFMMPIGTYKSSGRIGQWILNVAKVVFSQGSIEVSMYWNWRKWFLFLKVFEDYRRIPRISRYFVLCPWWRHQMETFSALLVLCEGNPLSILICIKYGLTWLYQTTQYKCRDTFLYATKDVTSSLNGWVHIQNTPCKCWLT